MKILIYGECDFYGTGAWCYFESCRDLGFNVDFYNPFTHLEKYNSNIFFKFLKKINKCFLQKDLNKHCETFSKKVIKFQPEIIIILKGLNLNSSLIKNLKKNAFIVLINHDDFFSKFKNSRSKIQLDAIGDYHHIFVTKKINVSEIFDLNPNVSFFQFSYFPKIHKQPYFNEEDEKKWSSDIVFIGNSYPKRRKQLEYLISNLGSKYKIRIYGGNWFVPSNSPLKGHITNKYLYPEDLQKAIFYSKICLCFLCEENRDDYTQRTFEIPACGGVLLAEETEMHKSLYKENEEAVFFDSNSNVDLLIKAQKLLEDETFRAKVRNKGIDAVDKKNFTYYARIEEIIKIYKNLNL